MGLELFAWHYTESVEAQTDCFAVAFVHEKVARHYEVVMTFESLQQVPFCLEKPSVRKRIDLYFSNISVQFGSAIWVKIR